MVENAFVGFKTHEITIKSSCQNYTNSLNIFKTNLFFNFFIVMQGQKIKLTSRTSDTKGHDRTRQAAIRRKFNKDTQ